MISKDLYLLTVCLKTQVNIPRSISDFLLWARKKKHYFRLFLIDKIQNSIYSLVSLKASLRMIQTLRFGITTTSLKLGSTFSFC